VKEFVLKEWHVLMLVATIIGGLFKSDISSALGAAVTIFEQRGLKGKMVQIYCADGSWQDITIVAYHYAIPFIHSGGVTVLHIDELGNDITENVSFTNWRSQRIRQTLDGNK
jgi:hypothetical protein